MAIKLIGIKSSKYESSSVEECLEHFNKSRSVQFDLESTSLDPHTGKIKCFQLGDFFDQYLVHPDYLQDFKQFLEEKELIGQNLKFDLRWLYKNNIFPTKVWDTYLAEGVLFCGLKLHKKNLAAIALRTIHIEIDKSIQSSIWKNEVLSDREIEYSAADVKYLDLIKSEQEKELIQKDLVKALEIENQFVLCLAYIEYCGFKLDKYKWKTKLIKNNKTFDETLEKLNQYIVQNKHSEYIEKQLDLFSSKPKISINWASSRQVIPLFKKLGINTTVIENGEKKDSIEATHLSNQIDKFDILPLYIAYKEAEKVMSTYGQGFLEHINTGTERVHTNFQQILNTGRVSSGGSGTVNMQNIPSDKETRACFVAEDDNILVIADYQSQEIVYMTNRSLDKGLLEFFDKDLKDIHSYNAKLIFPELQDKTLEEIKLNHNDKRQFAKVGSFALSYGAQGKTIADQLNISIEEGNKFYNAYFAAFSGLKTYFEKGIKESLEQGYIILSELTQRKSYVHNYEEFLSLKKEIDNNFWERYKILKKKKEDGYITDEYVIMKDKISKFFQIKGNIQRASQNYPVQGGAAELVKIACSLVYQFIQDNNLYNIVKFVGVFHDELVLECPIEMQEEIKTLVKNCMEDAGKPYCTRVPLKTDAFTSLFWKK